MQFINKKPKIFIIAGKARSGKDEISTIISNYYGDKKSITISFGYYIKDYAKRISNWDGKDETKPRELLQQLGIELIKNKIDDKLFIRRIIEDIEIFSYFYDIIIVNDARLIDEIITLKDKYEYSILFKVERNIDNNLNINEKNHITEIDFENYEKYDYIIKNNGNLNDLKLTVEKILKEV